MGRNRWNRNQGRGNQNDNNRSSSLVPKSTIVLKSSIEPMPVWKKRKVINARDMDAADDDVNYSRYARKASPPPDLKPPPSPPESKYKPLIKQEGKPRPEDLAIFSNINRSYDWNQNSTFSEVKPLKSELDFLAGLGTSESLPLESKPLISSLRRPGEQLFTSFVPKQEPREESPPPPKYAIPGLELMDMDDEDAFLYGDDANNDSEADVSSVHSRSRESHGHIRVEKDNAREREGSNPQEDDQARLQGYIKKIGLNNQVQTATGSSSSEASRRAAEIAKRVTETFKSSNLASAPAEKPADPRLRARAGHSKDKNAGLPAYQTKEAVENINSCNAPNSSPASNSAIPSEHYHGYQQQRVLPSPSNTYPPYQYDQPSPPMHQQQPLPVVIPGLMPPPPVPSQGTLSPYPSTQDVPLPSFVGAPTQSFPPFSAANTANAVSNPGRVSSFTPVVPVNTASRSNLKVIQLPEENSTQQKPSHGGNQSASTSGASSFKKGELRIPSTPEERKQLQQERLETKKRLDILNNQIADSRKKQGELMRKKQQKGGHTDQQLAKLLAANEVYIKHMGSLKKKLESIDKALKASEKIAHKPSASSNSLTRPKSTSAQPPVSKQCRYIDNGEHLCKYCHEILPLATDFLKHLHSSHLDVIERLAPADRPWATKPKEINSASEDQRLVPFQGVEFMLPSQAFFCSLCKEFSSDHFEARNHLESDKHNYNHSKFCLSNPNYTKKIQSERATSLAKKSAERKRKSDEALKDTRQSKCSKTASSHRRNHSMAASDNKVSEDSEDGAPSSKKPSTSDNAKNIKLNLLKGKQDNSSDMETNSSKTEERGEDVSFTISTPDSKISSKLKGKGVTTSMAPTQTTKEPVAMSLEDQNTHKILSNLKKKRKRNQRVERSESQPLRLEDFVRIGSEGGSPADIKLPKKAVQTIMTAAKEPQISPKLTSKAVPLPAKPTPASQVSVIEPSTKNVETAATKIVVPQAKPKETKTKSLEIASQAKEIGLQLPQSFEFEGGSFDELSEVLDAIPLPPELDDITEAVEAGSTDHDQANGDQNESTEMEGIEACEKLCARTPKVPHSEAAGVVDDSNIIRRTQGEQQLEGSNAATGVVIENREIIADGASKIAELRIDNVTSLSIPNETDNSLVSDNNQDMLAIKIDNVTSLSTSAETEANMPSSNDQEMSTIRIDCITSLSSLNETESGKDESNTECTDVHNFNTLLSAQLASIGTDVEIKPVEETIEQELDPETMNHTTERLPEAEVLTRTRDIYGVISPTAEDPALLLGSQPVEESGALSKSEDINAASDVSTDENELNSPHVARRQLALCSRGRIKHSVQRKGPASQTPSQASKSKENSLPIADVESVSAINNEFTKNSNSLTESPKARPQNQRAVCSRGRGYARVATKSLPPCSIVIKQEPIDETEAEKLAQRNDSISSNQVPLVGIKQEPIDNELADNVAGAVASSSQVKIEKSPKGRGSKMWGRESVAKSNTTIKSNDAVESGLLDESMDDAESSGIPGADELVRTLQFLRNLEFNMDDSKPSLAATLGEKLGNTLLQDDEDTVGLPPLASEDVVEKVDDLLKDPESDPRAEEGTYSDISMGSMEVVDEADTSN